MEDKPIVKVLSVQSIDWHALSEVADTHLGKKATAAVDSFGVRVDEQTAFIAALEYLRTGQMNIWNAVAETRHTATRHLFFNFLLVVDSDSAINLLEPGLIRFTRLVGPTKNVLVGGGSMRDWVEFVTHFSTSEHNTDVRYIANVLYSMFKQAKLSDLFCEFSAKKQGDGTFTLVRR